jgi:hypothetical protein
MEKYIRFRVLDRILEHIKDTTENSPLEEHLIFRELNLHNTLSPRDKRIIIEKFKRDDLISTKKITVGNLQEDGIYITFEGLLLLDCGGYVRKAKKETISIILQFLATLLIVLGTLAAGAYGLWVMYVYYHPIPHH